MKIVLDPGHGGRDPGAVDDMNPAEGDRLNTHEADLTLTLAHLCRLQLQPNSVVLTRKSDETLTLMQRVAPANRWRADLFISLHCNAATNGNAQGVEVLYHTSGRELAEFIQAELVWDLGAVDRGTRQRKDLYVLRHTTMPAVLVELGFVSNPTEEEKLNTESYLSVAARAMAHAVQLYAKGKGRE